MTMCTKCGKLQFLCAKSDPKCLELETQKSTQRVSRDEPGVQKDPIELPPTQIGRALQELQIAWIPAHSPQAKGRVERGFSTAQDRLVKDLRVAGISSLEQANVYL